MTKEGDINGTSNTNVRQDDGKKHQKGRKQTANIPFTFSLEASDDESGEQHIDVTPEIEWNARVDIAR
ncbi:hypothetical protein H5410_005176 [Solanum commersonii]|uniref:Uncharacterized protein n=1 Tax=Solanum commersonii TaxID=4109 RepID=A0A9J6A5P8_SOLCO|nr:hypothetical protein H5410_005176 [Solanum commersonii]